MGNTTFFGAMIAIALLLTAALAYAVMVQSPVISATSELSELSGNDSPDDANRLPSYFPQLSIMTTRNLTMVTNDKGSHAHMDMTIYRPAALPDGWYWVGDLAEPTYDVRSYGILLVSVKNPGYPGEPDLLAPPVDWRWVYFDHNSRATLDTGFWEPIPPDGYVALGCIGLQGYNYPDLSRYPDLSKFRCVRRDLVTQAVEKSVIWSDHGSGARYDCMLWSVTPADSNGIDMGTFWARHDYNMNPKDPVYCLDKSHVG